MKNLSTIIAFLLLSSTINAGDSRVFNEDMGKRMNEQIRQKNVLSITGYTFGYTNGVLEKQSYKSSVEVFDKVGNKTEDAVYLPGGESVSSPVGSVLKMIV